MSNRVVSEERVEPPAAVWCHSKVTARAERSSLSPRRGMRLQSIVRGINTTRAQIQCPASRLCSASWQCLDSAPRLEEGRRHILLNSLRTRQASRGRGGGSALRASALALRASKSAALQPGAQACGEWRRLFAARLEESGAPAWSTIERRVAAPVRGRVAAPHSVLRRRAGCGGGARVWRLRAYLPGLPGLVAGRSRRTPPRRLGAAPCRSGRFTGSGGSGRLAERKTPAAGGAMHFSACASLV